MLRAFFVDPSGGQFCPRGTSVHRDWLRHHRVEFAEKVVDFFNRRFTGDQLFHVLAEVLGQLAAEEDFTLEVFVHDLVAARCQHGVLAVYAELDRHPAPARYFADSDAQFELLGVMPARFNRLVVYRGSLLHSAIVNPRRLDADPRTGRLTVNTFYDF